MTNNQNRIWWRYALVVPAILLLFCSSSNLTGGSSGTEVSALAGTVFDEAGNPVKNAVVRIRPACFLADSSASSSYAATHSIVDTITGDDGTYQIPHLTADDYVVEVIKNDSLGFQAHVHIPENPTSTCKVPSAILTPLAQITGTVQMQYGIKAIIGVQAYGLARSATADDNGMFTILVPGGSHRFRISAYRSDDTGHTYELDRMDVSFPVVSGEHREAGTFQLRPPLLQPCPDGTCDSSVVSTLLRFSGNGKVPLASVAATNDKGRVVGLNCSGLDFSKGILCDIIRLSELQSLDFSGTRLMVMFSDIGQLGNLEILRLANNQISFLPKSVGDCKKLKELDLGNNGLFDLPEAITGCATLSKVNVAGNFLCAVDSTLALWIDVRAPGWHSTQRCIQPVGPLMTNSQK